MGRVEYVAPARRWFACHEVGEVREVRGEVG